MAAANGVVESMRADPTEVDEWKSGREESGAQGAAGASINAKQLTSTAPRDMSMMMHVMYGLDQYPQYFYKWPLSDVEEAIELLESRLRAAKAARDAMAEKAQSYVYRGEGVELELAPAARRMMEDGDYSEIREEAPGIYSFDLLSERCCEKLRDEIARYVRYKNEWISENGRHPPGVLRERLQLVDAGLANIQEDLFLLAKPLAARLFDTKVDTPHGYVIGYASSENPEHNISRKGLVPHVDDSEVTLNVCLSGGFEGGGLQFHGLRTPDETTVAYELPEPNQFTYQHQLGRAVMHLGNHFHEVKDVTAGERHVLIVWLRSWNDYRASHCPCCLKFRRRYCVCSPEWN